MLQNLANILQILIAAGAAYFVGLTFALVIWTFRDIQSRSQDLVVQILATLWVAVMNLPGLLIYLVVRPKDTLVESYERSLEEESLLQDIENRLACPNCRQRVGGDYLLCPNCLTQLKRNCDHCGKVLQLRWTVCPFCAREVSPAEASAPSSGARVQERTASNRESVRERTVQPGPV